MTTLLIKSYIGSKFMQVELYDLNLPNDVTNGKVFVTENVFLLVSSQGRDVVMFKNINLVKINSCCYIKTESNLSEFSKFINYFKRMFEAALIPYGK